MTGAGVVPSCWPHRLGEGDELGEVRGASGVYDRVGESGNLKPYPAALPIVGLLTLGDGCGTLPWLNCSAPAVNW